MTTAANSTFPLNAAAVQAAVASSAPSPGLGTAAHAASHAATEASASSSVPRPVAGAGDSSGISGSSSGAANRVPERADFDRITAGGAFAVLDQLAVIDAAGADAGSFLHTQLSNDVENLDSGAARLAGYCSPKGRLLASVLVWRADQTIRMLASADLSARLVKRLSMFVLRAKAKLADLSTTHIAIGIAGEVTAVLSRIFAVLPDTVHGVVTTEAGSLIRVPDAPAGRARFLWVTSREQFESHRDMLAQQLGEVPAALWDWLDIHAGEPRITAATYEQFVPQMINFEVLGGVNFKKGCYPGQEIVARSQYRGTIKRRAMLVHTEAASAGDEVFDSADPGQPCGMIVNAAPAPGGGVDCLVEIKLASLDSASVHVGSAQGPALTFLPLPYVLPSEA
ncbi:YgfZ/GcvT domain-containing protein [Pararobbsia alpina]|uniref:tRNA-modifying protein YgfZ n=1 Tax=Pararobbsia alpina TaxID=621374 RepID=A0A6S7CWK8_9BURK|nr:folate-binding protein YgfZ [Pararobbsia alpina]CAB3799409.1 tRNA-modifying protein YgfZ [Pararobbsia alpina]